MKPPTRFNPLFDRFLLGGLGCGLVTLCFLMAGFFYFWKNPPRPGPTAAPTQLVLGGVSTVTPGPTATPLFQFATPSVVPSGVPTIVTQTSAAPAVASPVPQFDSSPPAGKIVFTCYVNQVDQ